MAKKKSDKPTAVADKPPVDEDEKAHRALLRRLKTDLKLAAVGLDRHEARYLVDTYYQVQRFRITAKNQTRANAQATWLHCEQTIPVGTDCPVCECDQETAETIDGPDEGRAFDPEGKAVVEPAKPVEPNYLVSWIGEEMKAIEETIKQALGAYAENDPVGKWALSNVGIGPVIAAGLLAHIDINKATTFGAIYNFAGLNPAQKWEKGQKRPWNAKLKTLLWKAGQSFMKFSNKEDCFYGKLYRQRKDFELKRNESGENKGTAQAILTAKKIGKDTMAYKHLESGKLPPAQIDARARRWAVKMFISHYHHVATRYVKGHRPIPPYALAILGHGDYIPVPNYPWDGGVDVCPRNPDGTLKY